MSRMVLIHHLLALVITCTLLITSTTSDRRFTFNRTSPTFTFFGSTSPTRKPPRNITDLLDTLLTDYDHRLRPDFGGAPVEVLIDLHVRSMGPISEIDMSYSMDCYFRQNWKDSRLSYDPSEYQGEPENLALAVHMLDKIWKPDTYFYNGKNAYIHTITNPNKFVRIASDGMVLYSSRLTVKASCPMRLEKFPMDTQRCPLEVGSFGYTTKDVVYKWNPNRKVVIASDMKMSQFDLISAPTGNETGDLKKGGSFSKLVVSFHFKRLMGSFMIEVYAPGILLVVLSWVSFWINREATADRISLGIMTILTMTFLGLETRNDLPKVTYMTALDYFVAITFAFIFATIVQFAIVHFYTKVGSGEYYIPPIEILEDIKAFHRARQAEKEGEGGPLELQLDSTPLRGGQVVLGSLEPGPLVEVTSVSPDEHRAGDRSDHDDDYSGCNVHDLPCDVIVEGETSAQVDTVCSSTSARLGTSQGEMFHLTGHRVHGEQHAVRQYSSSAPPMSINAAVATATAVLPMERMQEQSKSAFSASGYSGRATSETRTDDYGCMGDVLLHAASRTGGGQRTMKQDCISSAREEEPDDEYRDFCPIHGQIIKSRSSELLASASQVRPFARHLEEPRIEVEDGQMERGPLAQDAPAWRVKRGGSSLGGGQIFTCNVDAPNGPRRRKNTQQKSRINRSEWIAATSDNPVQQTGDSIIKGNKNKSSSSKRKSESNPSSDSIPFRLNSVSKIDKCSRVLFPVTFAIINYFYWHTFMLEDSEDTVT